MKRIASPRGFFLRFVTLAAIVVLLAAQVQAIEPAQEFLDGLKELHYFDTAIEYLDEASQSPLVSPTFKEVIPYEKGLTLILASRTTRDMKVREKQLDEAQQLLQAFVESRQTHPYAALANSQRANLLVERAKISVERSKGQNVTDEQKNSLIADARKNYDEAIDVFEKTLADLKARLERFGTLDKKNPSHIRLIEIRDRYRADFLQARLLVPAIREEKADTYPEDAEERKTLLTKAATEFKDAHEDYRTRIAGLYAQLYEGRCYAKLKNEKEALYCFNSLLEQPDAQEFRVLKLKTLVLAVPLWLDSDPPKVDEALKKIDALLRTANRDEEKEPDWLYLAYAYGRASKMKADELAQKAPRSKEETADMVRNQRTAKGKLTFVARYPGDYQQAARDILKTMPDVDLPEEEGTGPLNFTEAHTKGKEALTDMGTAATILQKLQSEHQVAEAARKAELQVSMQETQKELHEKAGEAYKMLRLALELADADTPTEDMNVVRYLLCYLHFYLGDYYDAAALGEFVAMRYPQSSGARQCAKIAMASYIKARKDAMDAITDAKVDKAAATQFESEKITDICLFIAKQWSDQPEAAEAAGTLIIFSLQDQNFDKAREYLALIPEGSPKRSESERVIGQQIWTLYRIAISNLERGKAADDAIEAEKASRAADVSQAAALLEAGVGGIGNAPVDQSIASAALALAQIYVEQGAAEKAVKLVEDPKIGPLSLVKRKDPATDKPGYAVEAYKTSLRAYLGTLSSSDSATREAANKNAEDIIGRLQTLLSGTPEDKERLVAIFIGMASDLKAQMDALTVIAEKKAFAEGLANFLEKLNTAESDLNIRTWSADTFSKLGETFAASDPLAASAYYNKSLTAFTEILKDPNLTESTRRQIELRLGNTKLLLKDYQGALEEFAKILREKNSTIDVQVAAAMAYQKWGDELFKTDKKTADENYVKAMIGGFPDERQTIGGENNKNYNKNIIWGWGKLAQIAAGAISKYPQFRSTFYEARYNLAYSRWRLAELRNSPKYLAMAKNDVLKTTDWTKWKASNEAEVNVRARFDGLLRNIERSLGITKPKGLPIPSVN